MTGAGTWFLAVAEVYAPFEETEGDPQGDVREVDQSFNIPEEDAGSRPLEHSGVKEGGRPKYGMTEFDCTAQEVEIVSHPLEHSGVVEWAGVSDGLKKRNPPESLEICTDPAPVRKALEEEPIENLAPNGTPNEGSKPLNTDCPEDTEDGEAIIVGAVGSAAPWFLTGWTNEVEVEFMIDTGCQVTILATSVFEKMCTAHPQVRSRIRPCTRWLVSADSSPLTVIGQIDLDVVFPGLKCNMCCVVASIGSDRLLGTEALQSCLPHQLDLRTGQLWAEGRSTLQLHQQKPTPDATGLLLTAVVLPPDSEVVAPFSLNGRQLGSCALIVPDRDLTEEFGVVVGHTLVDASTSSAKVLIINPNAEEVVLPCRSSIGQLVPISAMSVARSELRLPTNTAVVLPEYLEDIVKGSHTSLGDTGRQSLRELLHRYEHVFPAPGEPATGRSKSVQHEIATKDGRPVRCGPRRLAPAGLRKDQECVKDMLTGGQIEPSDSPWASPVVLVTKKDGSTRFCVDYRRLNSLTIKDAYPLPRIDDSLRLLGNQQWFSTMDLASGYWQVAMSPEAKRKAAFVTNDGLFQFRVMPFGLCNAPATFERLMDRVLCGMHWSRCLVYLDDVISFGKSVPEALGRLEEVLARLSDFGLQLKAKKCTFMQTEVAFLGHIVGWTGLACDPEKLSAVRNWHEPNRVKAVRQFVGFVGYYRRFVKNFAELAHLLVALTRKGVPFVWGNEQQTAFDALKACSHFRIPRGRRPICLRHGRQFVCHRRCS